MSRELRGVAALVGLFSAIYGLTGLFRHWHFGSNYDLAIFDQAVWHLSRLEPPASTVSGFSNILGDHFYPIIAAFVPLYWVAPRVELLIAAQSLLFALSIVPVFLFLRRRLPHGSSLALAGAYGLFWGLQRAAAFDVHEVAFAPLIIATVILAMDRRWWVLLWTSAFALTLVREDLLPLLTFVGIYLVLHGERRKGAVLIAASVAALVVVVGITIPFFGAGYNYGGPYVDLLRRPWTIPAALVTPPAKLLTAVMWVAPFALLPLLSPLAVLLVPFVMSRLLSDVSSHWSTTLHYSAPLAPILAMSAGDAMARLARRVHDEQLRPRVVTGLTAASVLLALFLPGHQPLWNLFEPGHYVSTPVHRTGYRAMQRVPQSASVVAQGAALPHLSQREQAYILRPGAPEVDVIIASRELDPWPQANYEEIRQLLDERRARGYKVVFDENGWIVLLRN
ncbi:MAG: DUF2079 domain-containing protein [Acidobacteria bacterium]|nr:DUF2079 domain-containing protein [Acidobacteriota bacterium]